MPFSEEERLRYARQLLLPELGDEGQEKLKNASVLCIGTGGLGSPAELYLTAAGVGRLGLVDSDRVELSNLQRQILHGQSSLGVEKTDSARQRLTSLNPHVQIETYTERFTPENGGQILSGYDLLLDASDNYETRFVSNDACTAAGKPMVFGAVSQWSGMISVFAPHLGGPCYRCMLPEPPAPGAVPPASATGIIGAVPGVIGSLQAMEALKLILGTGTPHIGRLFHLNALSGQSRLIPLRKDPHCPCCSR